MPPSIQTILNLIDQNRVDEAFDELDRLQLAHHTLAQLRQEFEGGFQGVNYVQRLKMAVKSAGKRWNETASVPSIPTIEARIAQLTRLLEELRSSSNPEKASLEIPIPPLLRGYEKVIGGHNTLTNINWLLKGLRASRSVCRVVLPNRQMGTGFVLEGGYLLTNYHVFVDEEDQASLPKQDDKLAERVNLVRQIIRAKIEFNFEEDADGRAQQVSTYYLDPDDCKFSTSHDLDYAYVKIRDDPQHPLSQWGTLSLEDTDDPEPGQPTLIIQHPSGDIKQIAFEDNKIISVWKQRHYLFYKTTTLPGSSGSPVLNRDWRVIALHHAGLDEQEGGLVINEKGERQPTNRGILIKAILADIKKQQTGSS